MPWLGTFHSIGVKLLRRHAELAGLKSGFTILDTDDQIRLIKQLIQAEGLDDKRWPARQFAQMIDGWKNKGLGPRKFPKATPALFANGKGRELYKAYQERLQTLNACDFRRPASAPDPHLPRHPDVLAEYHRVQIHPRRRVPGHQHRPIHVAAPAGAEAREKTQAQSDGFPPRAAMRARDPASGEVYDFPAEGRGGDRRPPDFSGAPAQASERSERAAVSVNICCVGDDDQSIYGWRGAEVDNILRFEKDFPGATIIRLERNYRSTAHILGAASHLIAHNEGRLGKTLFTDRPDPEDDKVNVHAAWDSEEEARAVGEDRAVSAQRQNLNDMAILVRASFQMREFEDRFVTLGLNYRVIGGPRFYERQEIRDALAYFRVVASLPTTSPSSASSMCPSAAWANRAMRQIHDTARALRVPMLEAAGNLAESDELKPKPRAALREVAANFTRWQERWKHPAHRTRRDDP
jgi:DNA helicase-2/ATP-dependent DNA helicase PcrA